MVPSVGSFFTPIRLVAAFKEYDEFFALSRRRYVPPNFAELRHVLNLAQVQLLHPPTLNPIILSAPKLQGIQLLSWLLGSGSVKLRGSCSTQQQGSLCEQRISILIVEDYY